MTTIEFGAKACGHTKKVHIAGCDGCKEYQRLRVAANRAERLAEGRITHGTRSGYDAGCRDDCCRAMRIDAYERLDENRMQKSRDLTKFEKDKEAY